MLLFHDYCWLGFDLSLETVSSPHHFVLSNVADFSSMPAGEYLFRGEESEKEQEENNILEMKERCLKMSLTSILF